jgi:predicted nucleic acid-binding protein
MAYVLDNSVAIGWYFESQATPYTEAVLDAMGTETAYVPALWPLEFSNVLRKAIAGKKMSREIGEGFIADIAGLDIRVDSTAPLPGVILRLALAHNLTSYDAAYLELAMRMGLQIAAKDGPLIDAAITAGIGVFQP